MSLTGEAQDGVPRVKATAACLSQWQLSRWAMGLVSGEEAQAVAAHARTCDACQARAHAEQTAFAAAQSARVPASLRITPRPRWSLGLMPAWGLAACAVLAVAVWLVPGEAPRPDILLKGEATLQVAVRRDGVVREGTWQELGPARPGDQVRLKVPSAAPTWQRLTVRRGERWATLFAGDVAANDWVPLGLTVNQAAPSTLRLLVCPAAPAQDLDPIDNGDIPSGCSVYDTRL